jgi:hypothetical protein
MRPVVDQAEEGALASISCCVALVACLLALACSDPPPGRAPLALPAGGGDLQSTATGPTDGAQRPVQDAAEPVQDAKSAGDGDAEPADDQNSPFDDEQAPLDVGETTIAPDSVTDPGAPDAVGPDLADLLDPPDPGVPDGAPPPDAAIDVPPPVKGCVGKSVPSDGFDDLAITAPPSPLVVLPGKAAVYAFSAQGVKPDGSKGALPGGPTWEIGPSTAGTFDAAGKLTLDGSFAGPATVYAHWKSLCGQTGVTVNVQVLDVASEPAPGAGAALQQDPGKQDAQGPQIVYPPAGAKVPKDFAPITPQWKLPGAANVMALRFASDVAQVDLVGTPAAWKLGPGYGVTIPAKTWAKLFQYPTKTWTLRVLAGTFQGGKFTGSVLVSAPQALHVAFETAGGAIYYWNTALSAVRVLEPGQAQAKTISTPGGLCPGCHSISPDGSTVAVSFMTGAGFSSMSMALFGAKSGASPAWLHPDAKTKLATSFTISAAFSAKYFTATDKRLVVPTSGSVLPLPAPVKLTVFDLLKGTTKALVQGGDAGQQAFPAWSPDGSIVVYASSKNVGNGFAAGEPTALYAVPFNNGQGGAAQKIPGADTAGMYHYYPAFSPDGAWVAYNRAKQNAQACPQNTNQGQNGGPGNADSGTYDNCEAELWITKPGGPAPIQLTAANGPPPTQTNSWPTFGITKGQHYWLAFSSRRDYGFVHTGNPAAPQIWVSAVDPSELAKGKDGSYPALWLPGQDLKAGCHIARWSDTPRD